MSIFVPALHALVSIFRGKEVFIESGFGLVHGLAFAINIGIEVMQIFVIAITMPWLVLLARTRLYPSLRIAGASLTGIAAATLKPQARLKHPQQRLPEYQ